MKWSSRETIKRWDIHAETLAAKYTSQGDVHREVLLNPALFEFLGSVKNKRVLDAGCGEGYLSRLLAERNAQVVAVDYSQKMLEIARRRTPASCSITYHHGNCENLDFLADKEFDVVVSNMVLQDLADYKNAIREMYRLLVAKGLFIFSIAHPCFSTPLSGWVKNEQGEKCYWKIDQYFKETVVEQSWPPGTQNGVVLFHRTLTSYVRAALDTGFIIMDIAEPKPSPEMIQKYPHFKDDLRMCHFLIFKLRK